MHGREPGHLKRSLTLAFLMTLTLGISDVGTTASQPSSSTALQESLDEGYAQRRDALTRLNAITQEQSRAAAELAVLTGLLMEAQRSYSTAEKRQQGIQKNYEERLVSLYKMGDEGTPQALLTGESFNEVLVRLRGFLTLQSYDKQQLEHLRAAGRALADEKEGLALLKLQQLDKYLEEGARKERLLQELTILEEGLGLEERRLAATIARELEEERARQMALARELAAAVAREEQERERSAPLPNPANDALFTYKPTLPPAGKRPSGQSWQGLASWYGPGFHGRTQANGSPYDMYAYTIAHKTLPLDTHLKITRGGYSVYVTVTDRGPYIEGREFDLSYAAAAAVGHSGVGPVVAEIWQ